MLSKEREQWYLEHNGGRCPNCTSSDIARRGQVYWCENTGWQDIHCRTCGAEWQDVYTLVGVNNFQKGDQ